MKNSSKYINEKVFKTNQKYARLQNKTEELFFQCLDEGKDLEYFYKKLDDIWGNIDHSFIENDIQEYVNLIEQNNLEYLGKDKETLKDSKLSKEFLVAVGIGTFISTEQRFKEVIARRYKMFYNSPEYKRAKDEYLKRKVKSYDNQVVPYFNETTGEIIRYVQLSTYLSMKYNTAMTRAGWEKTLDDAELLGYTKFWIPPHAFSCKHCAEYQGIILTYNEVIDFTVAEEQEGDILHPNCKCELLIYTPLTNMVRQTLPIDEIEEEYEIRQKMNSLTLKKERILTDIRVQGKLGNQDEVDKLNSQRNKINTQIRELIDKLPTKELKTKVVAINR